MTFLPMDVTGFTSNDDFTNPMIILRDELTRRIFPISLEGYSRDDFFSSFVMSGNVYSDILRKLLGTNDLALLEVRLTTSDNAELTATAKFAAGKTMFTRQFSPQEGAVLCMEAELPIMLHRDLLSDNRYFRKQAPELSPSEKILSALPDAVRTTPNLRRKKDIIQ